MYKQVIVIRKDLNMGKGKIAVQACHASLFAYECANWLIKIKWKRHGAKKIVVYVNSEKELLNIYKNSIDAKLPCYLVKDAGKTQIKSGTYTALAIGPAKDENIDSITGKLKLL